MFETSSAAQPAARQGKSRGCKSWDPDYLSAETMTSSDSNHERGSLVEFTVEPLEVIPADTPRLEELHIQDRSVTPGKSRKRQMPQEPVHPRPQPKVFSPNYDDGSHRVFAGAKKQSAYDFDSPVASMSVLDKKSNSTSSVEDLPVNKLTLQPETRQISEEQLINEVRTIYAGLVLVERKCVEIDHQQASLAPLTNEKKCGKIDHQQTTKQATTPPPLTNEQWQALIALHRTLLHEHHDFFLASQHPAASPTLQKLASRYAMPARMWRHGIHAFLELLRHRLPESLDHMLAFIYTSYSMMALLLESVPSFEDTWIECLGDLARYRMAVEESDLRDREVWAGVARYWYHKAADKSPEVGRIQHHLAVLARPNILQQLFFYTKSLVAVQPFPNTKESIMLLFNPVLDPKDTSHHSRVMLSFVRAHATLFTRRSALSYLQYGYNFLRHLGTQIGRVGSKWREQGVYIASANFAAIFEYDSGSLISTMFHMTLKAPVNMSNVKKFYQSVSRPVPQIALHPRDAYFQSPREVIAYATSFAFRVLAFVLKQIGDKNVIPHVHVSLAFIWALALVPEAMSVVQHEIPWEGVVMFLNTLNTQGVQSSRLRDECFPVPDSGSKRHLPEDFSMRGLIWSQLYYPADFFEFSTLEDDDERLLEPPSITAPRTERCLWLGHRIASLNVWISFDEASNKFTLKDFAIRLATLAKGPALFAEAEKLFGKKNKTEAPSENHDMVMKDADPLQTVEPGFRSPEKT